MSSAAAQPSAPRHEGLVSARFSPQAQAYVASEVHAKGADLAALAERLAGAKVGRMLDLGCGGGHVAFTAAPHVGHVVAYDLSTSMLQAVGDEARKRSLDNISTEQGVAEDLPFDDNSFDLVVSRYSAHHWSDVGAGLRQARRVVKDAGTVIFMDVVAPPQPLLDTFMQSIEILRDTSHVRDYSVPEWAVAAEKAGLVLTEVVTRRLRLEFSSWIARMKTPEVMSAAIRALQDGASAPVRAYFEIEPDGTFTVDTASMVFKPV
ncbi:S-adenosyl-L-methionine (SAM)-dependent methyltransferase PhcB [Azorhizobium oxalatiphilum]|uniref:S-adenosyl-L-methionine (SAM)-dependent methyltransferase PhcB n=1 Tax=Azorhizobium oxalatiphilum TaxID=980631 RepID=A0A917C7Y1_9HYPH|nr:class I SAM-dependent methyltransferase [Azorhizobium oxalatiphilum]GGF76719.1 S-adenosyl-L-methionine (SAM)-dependent methyltransferase PhcB [Azorhizobium oxalatiphilum]